MLWTNLTCVSSHVNVTLYVGGRIDAQNIFSYQLKICHTCDSNHGPSVQVNCVQSLDEQSSGFAAKHTPSTPATKTIADVAAISRDVITKSEKEKGKKKK